MDAAEDLLVGQESADLPSSDCGCPVARDFQVATFRAEPFKEKADLGRSLYSGANVTN